MAVQAFEVNRFVRLIVWSTFSILGQWSCLWSRRQNESFLVLLSALHAVTTQAQAVGESVLTGLQRCFSARASLRFAGRLFVVFLLVVSWGAEAAIIEDIPPLNPPRLVWCSNWGENDTCLYSTDSEAAQAFLQKVAAQLSNCPLFGYCFTFIGCDGKGNCTNSSPPYGAISGLYVNAVKNYCPVPTNYPTIPYEYIYRYGIYSCHRFVPETLTITLSGGTSVKPWHRKWDQDHTSSNSNLPYKAMVKDQDGQPKAGIEVTITSDVTPGSGGHAHDDINRPKGWLAKTPAEIAAQIQAGATQASGTLAGVTDSAGIFAFTFGAEEASGLHMLTATCTGCSNTATTDISVEIPGLMLLNADPLDYVLRGETDSHPGNHYFSPAAIVVIINLAYAYLHDPDFKQLLMINDSSLVNGGVFDLKQDWTYPNGHQGHRKGTVVDINNYRNGPDPDFEQFALDYGVVAVWEGPDLTSMPHYHLWLLGKDE